MNSQTSTLRPVITWTVAVCAALATAPWLSGGQEPLALLLSAGAVLLGSLLLWRQPAVRRLRRGPLVWSYGGLLGWAVLSLLWTANRYSTVLWIVGLALAGLVFRLAYTLAGEMPGRQALARLYLTSAAVFAGYGFWLYFTDAYDRFTSSFYWANPAAAYLMPAILLAVHGLRDRGRRWWVWLALLALYGTAFMLADSRAATLVLAVAAGMYWLAQKQSKRYWITLVFSLVGVFILGSASVQLRHYLKPDVAITTPGSRFAEAATGESKSGSDRLEYLVSAANMWWSHPWQGVGAGAYGDVHPGYQRRVVSASTSAHNFYVQTLAELGIVGVLLLAWLLLALLLGGLRGLVQYPAGVAPLALGLVALLAHGGLDIDFRYPALLGLAALLAGLIYAQSKTPPARVSWRLPALAVLTLVPVVSLYLGNTWAERAKGAQADGDFALAADEYDQSRSWLVYNPDWTGAAGINYYTQAIASSSDAQRQSFATLALSHARQAEDADPADGQHHQLEGRIRLLQGDTAGAEAAFRAALRLDPHNHPEYAWDLAMLQLSAGQPDAALATTRGMLELYPDSVIDNRSNDVTIRPTVANLWALAGNIELQRGDTAAARAAAGRALTIDRQNLRGRALKHQLDTH